MTRRLITRAIALAALALPVLATPAGAVIGGTPDGSRHPYVGAVDGRPVGGATQFGSGVLISPTVFLTVAHGTAHFDAAGITRARVTFDPIAGDSSTWYEGTIHTNPAYQPSAQGQRGDFGDLGVIVFDTPIPGITPASLPSAGYLDRISGHPALEIPGYGQSTRPGAEGGSVTHQARVGGSMTHLESALCGEAGDAGQMHVALRKRERHGVAASSRVSADWGVSMTPAHRSATLVEVIVSPGRRVALATCPA
jgi:hypothetical protein